MTTGRPTSALALASLLAAAGASHFVATDAYARIVPRSLGHPELWVYVSGVAELACAGGLVTPATRRAAALATAGLLVAVFPANVQMARDADTRSTTYRAVAYARLPVQVPLVLWALAIARRPTASRRRPPQARPSSR